MPKQSKPKKKRQRHTFEEWVEAIKREYAEQAAKKTVAK